MAWLKFASVALGCSMMGVACSLVVDTSDLTGGERDASLDAGEGSANVDSGSPSRDAGSAYANLVLSDGPRAYWRMDESSGSTLRDIAGSNNATLHGGVTFGVAGAIVGDTDTALHFDGATTLAELNTAFDFTGTSAYTLEAWVNSDVTDDAYRMIFSKNAYDDAGREEYAVFVHTGSTSAERYVSGEQVGAGGPSIPSKWTHVVAVYDGSTLTLYLNAKREASAPDTRSQPSKPAPFSIGAQDDIGDPFLGSLDELAVYDKPLSAARVQAHYSAGIGPAP